MTEVSALLRYLKKKTQGSELLIDGNSYSASEIKLAEQILLDADQEFQKAHEKPKLSRRRAFIVILEELYYDIPEYPENLTLENIHRRASLRFEYMNRNIKAFKTPTEVHPKDPCTYYEDNAHGKARYRVALKYLVNEFDRYFKEPNAEFTLKNKSNEIKLC